MRLAMPGRRLVLAASTAGLVLIVAAVALFVFADRTFPGRSLIAADSRPPSPPKGGGGPDPGASEVSLAEGKLRAAGIEVEPARMEPLRSEIAVPALIDVNVDRQVAIKPRVPGVIREVPVVLGQQVEAGDVLAVLESADVGKARLDVRARQLDLSIAQSDAEWKSTVAANVAELVAALRKGISAVDIQKRFGDRPLGSRRAELLEAYANWEIAHHEWEAKSELFRKKLIGEHVLYLAQHTEEAARAKYDANLEQVNYDAPYQKRLADQQVRRAEAGVTDAVQRLRLLGAEELPATGPGPGDVTAYPILAPFDGTINHRSAVPSQQVGPADALFDLIDLSTVRVSAKVPESDLAALPTAVGGTFRLTAEAYPGRSFRGRIIFVGREVDPASRTVPLVAEADNAEGLLRPGMFARVVIDAPPGEPVLTVPAAAVVEIDGRPAVFVPVEGGSTFALRRVRVGRTSAGRTAVADGLEAGERVVSEGAFDLKSELIQQNEPEEE